MEAAVEQSIQHKAPSILPQSPPPPSLSSPRHIWSRLLFSAHVNSSAGEDFGGPELFIFLFVLKSPKAGFVAQILITWEQKRSLLQAAFESLLLFPSPLPLTVDAI